MLGGRMLFCVAVHLLCYFIACVAGLPCQPSWSVQSALLYNNYHLYCYNVLLDCDICPWDICEAGVWSLHCCHCAIVVCVIKLRHKIKFALESWDIWLTLTFALVGYDIFIAVWWHLHCFGPWHLHRQAVTSTLVCSNICSVRLCGVAQFRLQCLAVVSAS